MLDVLQHWLNDSGVEALPAGISALRNALLDDLDRGDLGNAGGAAEP